MGILAVAESVSDTDLHPMKQVPAASDFAAVFSGLIA
jgi:hypothetical protein